MKALLALALLSSSAHAFEPAYIASDAEKAGLESYVKNSLQSVTKVKCHDVFTIATGGNRNSATAGVCILDGEEYELACTNNIAGGGSQTVRLHPTITEESELRLLIEKECTGG